MKDPNWQADCANCVGSKFTCDEHFNGGGMSCKAPWTPGPWDVTTVDHSSGGSGASPSTLFRVAFPSHKDFTGHVADKCHGDSYANARLIAAAPEMAKLLRKIADRKWNSLTQGCNAISDAQREARALLSRIEGEGA